MHLRIDDDFPEISETLLSILYPHFIQPIPSMTVAEFHLDPNEGKMTSGFKVDAGSMLYSRPVGGIPCKFRTAHDVTMWPITVDDAQWRPPDQIRPEVQAPEATAVCRLKLKCLPDTQFKTLQLSRLRFYLSVRAYCWCIPLCGLLFAQLRQESITARSAPRFAHPAGPLARARAAAGRVPGRRSLVARAAPILRGLPAATGIFRFTGKVLLLRSDSIQAFSAGTTNPKSKFCSLSARSREMNAISRWNSASTQRHSG